MILDPYYSLRKKFSIIGLTGRSASGCSQVADLLSDDNFCEEIKVDFDDTIEQEILKQKICNIFIKSNQWTSYKILKYRDTLILLLLSESFFKQESIDSGIEKLFSLISGLGNFYEGDVLKSTKTKRINQHDNISCFENLKKLIYDNYFVFDELKKINIRDKKTLINSKEFNNFYFNQFTTFTEKVVELFNQENYFLRCLLFHDLATSLRSRGKIELTPVQSPNIFLVAEQINWILKNHKEFSQSSENLYVIDSLKNSLELTYFKEKYSAFYMLSINKSEEERLIDLNKKLKEWVSDTGVREQIKNKLINLDEVEYKSKEVNSGIFSSPDVENCIQKSDYHIYFSKVNIGKFDDSCIHDVRQGLKKDSNYNSLDLRLQLIKLLSLIFSPGLITPSNQERLMQVAFTAKLSSGCISRQVGAIVTDKNYSVKAIGWNDVAENQIPCNLRDYRDLRDSKNEAHFSEFELNLEDKARLKYKDNLSFKEKIDDRFSLVADLDIKLGGKPCGYCFKSCHNVFEKKENQVHTRSLHAEENAMLQISKYGGQSLKGGFLFTTASPCELCAKKAFQLGLTKIYYIDPYPGISRFHTLRNGINDRNNPHLIMYQGAISRGYLRLYQPFMSYKDELGISIGVKFSL